MRTPLALITGFLGSGKTTLVRRILRDAPPRLAVLMNEFGELSVDARIVEGKNVRIAELTGGCVCCSLQGEFEAAVEEIIDTVAPELIVVETTGVAEPESLVVGVGENLPGVRLDGVITIADADAMKRFPAWGGTLRAQIESADIVLLNKMDLAAGEDAAALELRIRGLNRAAVILRTTRCAVDPAVLFGAGGGRRPAAWRGAGHREERFESFVFAADGPVDRRRFEAAADALPAAVYRSKGRVRFPEAAVDFSYVAGRWELERCDADRTELVFIGRGLREVEDEVRALLEGCEVHDAV